MIGLIKRYGGDKMVKESGACRLYSNGMILAVWFCKNQYTKGIKWDFGKGIIISTV